MDSNELIQIARECGAVIDVLCMGRHDNVVFTSGELQQFAQRIRADALREASDFCLSSADKFTTKREDMAARSIALALKLMTEGNP